MTNGRVPGLCCFVLLLAVSSASAQEIRVRVVQSGADHLTADLKDIVALTPNKALQKQWKNLNDTLDGFLMGIDRTKPMRVDYTIAKDAAGKAGLGNEPSFPIKNFAGKDGFLANIKSFGYNAKKSPKDETLYEITEAGKKNAKPMFLRYVHGYATISETAKAVPANLPDPVIAVKHLLNYDVAGELKNEAAGMENRQAEFQSLRKELEAAIKFKRNEDKSEFELRKLGTAQFFDEIERFLVEAELLVAGWTTTPGAKDGHGALQLTALPNTALMESVRQLSTKPSYFATVQLHDHPVLAGKLLFPLDKMRKAHAEVRHPLMRAATKAAIDKRPKMTDDGKAAAKDALDKLVDIFDASLGLDFPLDGFIDMYDAGGGQHAAVMAMRAEKAKLVDEIVGLLPRIRDGWQVKPNAIAHGGVSIHEITIPQDFAQEFKSLFGDAPMTMYVGASEQAVWGAAGKDALETLKAAIDQQAQPAPETPDPVFASISIKFGPWIKLIEVIETNLPQPEKPTKQEVTRKKERDRLRQLALEAFEPGTDLLNGKLSRDGDEVKGEMSINEAVFRFIGSAIADFSKQNLSP